MQVATNRSVVAMASNPLKRRFVATVTAAAILGLPFFTACALCSSVVLNTVASPGSMSRAYLIEVDCGATVDYSRQVTLAHGQKVPRPRLTESVTEQGTVFRAGGRPQISVKWNSETAVTISYQLSKASDRVFRQDTNWDGVSIRYAVKPSP
jgi:hypothetical protein